MSLRLVRHIALPGHGADGRLDHAAVHTPSSRLFLAHTSNDAMDIIDCASDEYLRSIGGLREVAGMLVSEDRDLIFSSNRGEDTISIMPVGMEEAGTKVEVGHRPNGLAFDPSGEILLVANLGDVSGRGSHAVSLIDVRKRFHVSDKHVPGRTRWALYDPGSDAFYVNIMDPPQILAIDARDPSKTWSLDIPARGPHGLDLDQEGRRLFCACDDGKLVVVEIDRGKVSAAYGLTGKPDVVFFNRNLGHLYVALKEPGAIDLFDTEAMDYIATTKTEAGAGTIAFDRRRNKVYSFLPRTSRAAVYRDTEA